MAKARKPRRPRRPPAPAGAAAPAGALDVLERVRWVVAWEPAWNARVRGTGGRRLTPEQLALRIPGMQSGDHVQGFGGTKFPYVAEIREPTVGGFLTAIHTITLRDELIDEEDNHYGPKVDTVGRPLDLHAFDGGAKADRGWRWEGEETEHHTWKFRTRALGDRRAPYTYHNPWQGTDPKDGTRHAFVYRDECTDLRRCACRGRRVPHAQR